MPPSGCARRIAGARSEVLVADADGAVVGICTVYLDLESVRFGQRAWVEDLAVTPTTGRRATARRCSTRPRTGRASAAPRTSSSTPGEARADAHRFYEREQPS